MYEDAQEIFNFLPLNRTVPEDNYINHLWDVFLALDSSGTSARSFMVLPIHLLFMLSLQYKVMRIAKAKPRSSNTFFAGAAGRNKETLLNPDKSVFDIAFIYESTLPEIFRLIKVDENQISKIKYLVNNRNEQLAHAKGSIENDPEEKISQYFEILRNIQPNFLDINNKVANAWLKEMGTGQSGVDYMETHFIEEYLCPADMQQGKLAELDKRLNGNI